MNANSNFFKHWVKEHFPKLYDLASSSLINNWQAFINRQNNNGQIPLILAIAQCNLAVFKYLLKK